MSEQSYFMVYRTKNDEPDTSSVHLYGWTMHKTVVKAFMRQRTKGKYNVVKMYEDEIEEMYSESPLSIENMIDEFIFPMASSNGDKVVILSTKSEMYETEVRIQKYFRELPKLLEDGDDMHIIELFLNLKEYYSDALEFIGFRPMEIESLFGSDTYIACENSIELIKDEIEDAYISDQINEYRTANHSRDLPGLSKLTEPYSRVLYSLEAAIKVLKEEL